MVELNFYADFVRILKEDLINKGFSFSSQSTNEDIFLQYLNFIHRLIPTKQRKIIYSKDFKRPCDEKFKKGLELVEDKIKKGKSINSHLSRKIGKKKLDSKDELINDWNIFHIHLGIKFDSKCPNQIEGTSKLLFAFFDEYKSYFIGIYPHNSWSKKEILNKLYENFPELLAKFELKGVKLNRTFSNYEIESSRKEGVTLFHEINGKCFAPLGLGFTRSEQNYSKSFKVVLLQDDLVRKLKQYEDKIKNDSNLNFKENDILRFVYRNNLFVVVNNDDDILYRTDFQFAFIDDY